MATRWFDGEEGTFLTIKSTHTIQWAGGGIADGDGAEIGSWVPFGKRDTKVNDIVMGACAKHALPARGECREFLFTTREAAERAVEDANAALHEAFPANGTPKPPAWAAEAIAAGWTPPETA